MPKTRRQTSPSRGASRQTSDARIFSVGPPCRFATPLLGQIGSRVKPLLRPFAGCKQVRYWTGAGLMRQGSRTRTEEQVNFWSACGLNRTLRNGFLILYSYVNDDLSGERAQRYRPSRLRLQGYLPCSSRSRIFSMLPRSSASRKLRRKRNSLTGELAIPTTRRRRTSRSITMIRFTRNRRRCWPKR